MNIPFIQTQQYAATLIRDGMRLALAYALTGVSKPTLREFWDMAHGHDAPPLGRLPCNTIAFIKSGQSPAMLSAVVSVYFRAEKERKTPVEAFVIAWEASKLISGEGLDINAAWYAIRDVKAGLVLWNQCKSCKAGFIFGAQSNSQNKCPYCGMSDTKIVEVVVS